MKEQYFFADVDLPFHVWVRERCGKRGYRWVLRDASHLQHTGGGPVRAATERGTASRPGTPAA